MTTSAMTMPVHGTARFQEDPHWRDYPLFYEYFHGDTGAGAGASHQTGWSGAIARIGHLFASFKAHEILEQSKGKSAGGTLSTGEKEMTQVLHPIAYEVNLPRPGGRGFFEVHPQPRLFPHLERWGLARSNGSTCGYGSDCPR